MTRELQTTPEMCQHELAMYSQMERAMTADAWLAMDAIAAHELLELVQKAVRRGGLSENNLFDRMAEWVTP